MQLWNYFLYFYFAILILVIINAMIMMTRSFKETTVNAELIGFKFYHGECQRS